MSEPMNQAIARDLSDLVTAVFRAWREAGVAFLILRNYENLPQDVSNDIDVLVRPAQLAEAERVMVAAARSTGFLLHNRAEFSPVSYFFHQPGSLHQIQIDLFYNQQWRGFDLLSANIVLDRRSNRGLFSIPNPVHEAVTDLLTRLMFHGYVKENYKQFIAATARAEPVKMEATLAEIFGAGVARHIMRGIGQEEWAEVEACYVPMRRQLILRRTFGHPWRTLVSLARDQKRFLERLLHPPGITIALVGPDGSGKSTVATKLAERLVHTFRPDKSLRVHWKPVVFFKQRRAGRPPTTDPHGQPPRNALLSILFLGYHWLEYFLGGWLQFMPVRFRNGLVLIDRSHFDFKVDPRRYRLNVSPGLVRFLFRFVPRPNLVFVLDAPVEVLQSRKAEVTPEETRRQCAAFRQLATQLPNARVVDCAQPIEAVVREITSHTLRHLLDRQSGRS